MKVGCRETPVTYGNFYLFHMVNICNKYIINKNPSFNLFVMYILHRLDIEIDCDPVYKGMVEVFVSPGEFSNFVSVNIIIRNPLPPVPIN